MFTRQSFRIGSRTISISMEEEFWDSLRDIAADRNTTVPNLVKEIVAKIDGRTDGRRMASLLRVYVLEETIRGAAERKKRRTAVS